MTPDNFTTIRDLLRYAVTRFNTAELFFGHGNSNALDEAAYLILHALKLPLDKLEPFLDARLLPDEVANVLKVIERLTPDGPNRIRNDVTFIDPKALTRPWNVTIYFDHYPDWRIQERICENNKTNNQTEGKAGTLIGIDNQPDGETKEADKPPK